MSDPTSWELKPGQRLPRRELHDRYGGRIQGGVGPSKRAPYVLLFTDPPSGERHGYYDGWQPDGCFHYTGEGQFGDQRMMSGNRSILHHQEEGRSLHLFRGPRSEVEYVGKFALDPDMPWYETDAPESGGGPLRKVIVFRLRPVDTTPPEATPSKIADVMKTPPVQRIPVEDLRTEKTYVDPARKPYEAEQRESVLVLSLATYLRGLGHEVCRLRIIPKGEFRPLFSDLYDNTTNTLIEAKGSVTRESIRMAIGQLADYSRFLRFPRKAILLPSRPRPDLEDLARTQDVDAIWPHEAEFSATDPKLLMRPHHQ